MTVQSFSGTLAWCLPGVEGNWFDQSTVMFSPELLVRVEEWQRKGFKWEPVFSVKPGDGTRKDAIITVHAQGGATVWRLTGDMDDHGGYIGIWPD